MGDVLSGVLGTNNSVDVSNQNPYAALNGWQDRSNRLADLLEKEANGGGPNPAQQQLLQNFQDIAQGQATNYAQNRAISPGLAARLSAMNAASLGSRAASTAGIQQAQQDLGAQSELGGLSIGNQGALNQAGSINAGIAQGNQKASEGIVGGILNAGGGLLGLNGLGGGLTGSAGGSAGGAAGGAASAAGAGGGGYNPNLPTTFEYANSGGFIHALKRGGHVPGHAQVDGDSIKNDNVPAMLSPGEIVIPRTKAKNSKLAKEFIDHLMSEGGKVSNGKDGSDFGGLLKAHRELSRKVKSLEGKLKMGAA